MEGNPMRFRTLVGALGVLALAAAGCGDSSTDLGAGGGNTTNSSYEIVQNASFDAGSTMDKLAKAKKIVVGVKYDQPGIGNKNPATGKVEGFDIEIAKIIAGRLGLDYNNSSQVEFKETISANRQPFIQNGNVDIVAASYSITDTRKKVVSFAGPYYITGQDLLIRKDSVDQIKGPDDLSGKKVCSVKDSTPLGNIQKNYPQAQAVPFGTYTECVQQLVNKQVDVVTTDGAILLGYAARQPDLLQVVGKPFSTEKYGIGLKQDDTAFRNFIDDVLQKAYDNGDWKKAYDATLGKSGSAAPTPPALERY
jgi:glutamate transport system substrate-binding protein